VGSFMLPTGAIPSCRFPWSLPNDERVSHSHYSSGIPPPPEQALLVLEAREGTSFPDQTTYAKV
jgi:hypothetical protein